MGRDQIFPPEFMRRLRLRQRAENSDSLTFRERLILRMHHLEACTDGQIAARLGVDRGQACRLRHAAEKKLAKLQELAREADVEMPLVDLLADPPTAV